MRSEPLLLSIKQAADQLGVSDNLVRRMIATGRIAHVQLGVRKCMIPRDAIERFIADNTVQPCQDAITVLAFATSKSAGPSTSSGLSAGAAGSAARAQAIAGRLKSRSRVR